MQVYSSDHHRIEDYCEGTIDAPRGDHSLGYDLLCISQSVRLWDHWQQKLGLFRVLGIGVYIVCFRYPEWPQEESFGP